LSIEKFVGEKGLGKTMQTVNKQDGLVIPELEDKVREREAKVEGRRDAAWAGCSEKVQRAGCRIKFVSNTQHATRNSTHYARPQVAVQNQVLASARPMSLVAGAVRPYGGWSSLEVLCNGRCLGAVVGCWVLW